jgi:hypothetical protein
MKTEAIYTESQARPGDRWLSFYPESGIRVVGHGDYESWSIYTIVPRAYLLRELRKLKRQGLSIRSVGGILGLLPQVGPAAPRCYGYGGPGQAFNRETCIWCRGRRFHVFFTSGGLDI